jgi:hypothetical protein
MSTTPEQALELELNETVVESKPASSQAPAALLILFFFKSLADLNGLPLFANS